MFGQVCLKKFNWIIPPVLNLYPNPYFCEFFFKGTKNSVWVGKKIMHVRTCYDCFNRCKRDNRCKSVIHSKGIQQCTFNYGTEPLIALALPPHAQISSAQKCESF